MPFLSTGDQFPAKGETRPGGLTAWVNAANISANDGADATCNGAGSNNLLASDFGISIPTESTVTGVTVKVEGSEHSGGTESVTVALWDGASVITNTPTGVSWSGTAKAVYTYGGPAYMWQQTSSTLTPALVNSSGFGCVLYFTTSHDIRVDYITLAVEYTIPASPTQTKGFFMNAKR